MRIRNIEKKDYNQLVLHCKNVLNYYSFFNNYNDDLNVGLATYLLHNILASANYGFVLDYNGLIVGVFLGRIPSEQIKENIFTYDELKDIGFDDSMTSTFFNVQDANQEEIKNLEFKTNEIYHQMIDKYSDIVFNKPEILLFSILPKHRGRGLSNIMLNKFKYDITGYDFSEYYLFTTTLCDYRYYEHKKMQFVKELIYDETNASHEMARFLPLPTYGIIYYTNIYNDKNYDGVAEEIIHENDEEIRDSKERFDELANEKLWKWDK